MTLEEIIKNNPIFIAFSKEEIYNELYDFFKNKNKVSNILNLFYDVVYKKKNIKFNNNYIIITEAFRKDLINEEIEEFISKIKKRYF
jgi:hypothetical protein